MIDDPNRIFDGYSNLSSGVDGGRLANLIDPTQVAEAQNFTFRGGAPTQRPPFLNVSLTFDNSYISYFPSGDLVGPPWIQGQSLTNFEDALFQGAAYFGPQKGMEYIMASIGGRLYRITPSPVQTAHVFEVQLFRRNSQFLPFAYMVQAGAFFIVQDGDSGAIIFDGVNGRRAGKDEIFPGRFMAVGQGRIVLIGNDGFVYFGDIRDGLGNGDADMLKFTETLFLNEGFPSALPSDCGFPRAVAFLPQQDAATGMGDCIVFGTKGAEGFTLSIPRDQWKTSQFQRPVLRNVGATGHRSVATVNNDIFFRSRDGWRSYRQARAEVDKWSQIPLSTNVNKWTDAETPSLLEFCSAIAFDNRLIGSATPIPNQGRLYHTGALALDFDILSSFGGESQPAWDGQWTNNNLDPLNGLKLLQLVEGEFDGVHRAFAFVLDDDGKNALVELQRLPTGHDSGGQITGRMVSRSMEFESPMNEKSVYGGDLWVDSVKEETAITVRYRPDQVPFFSDWDSFTVEPISGVPEGDATVTQDGYDPRHSLPKPDETADVNGTNRLLRRGYEFQVELVSTGRAVLRKFRAHAELEEERSGPNE